MRHIHYPLLLLSFFFVVQTESYVQTFLKAEGTSIVNEAGEKVLLRGIGLGGWMLQEGYMLQTAGFANAQYEIRGKIEELIGKENTDQFYEAWLTNFIQKEDIAALKSWGFNSVRLPMHYNLFTLPIHEEPVIRENTWLDKGFELTDQLISWCREYDVYVVLDLHAAPGGQGYDAAISDYDPEKPSLWESRANRGKMVALWKKLAERYADEPVVAGYDLLNEPNWHLPGNRRLLNLYQDVTAAIRSVDSRHIVFIEGNWFATDFTNLIPPWDDNLVYSPHKYWSFNDQDSIQLVLDIRDTHNVPLYLGESGENSNTWFRDAIHLLESEEIGWAWWPWKKVDAIAGPLSVRRTQAYQSLLDYWNGEGSEPDPDFANQTLFELAENMKLENCRYQPDVIDAMFRQVNTDETTPFISTQQIPGVVYATDFDMGKAGIAFFDTVVANYHLSTGTYTAWNNGWAYRNDGVDIEPTKDRVNSNGYNVGWIEDNEWMQYTVEIAADGMYEANMRVASKRGGGSIYFKVGESRVSPVVDVPSTGGWQRWVTLKVPEIVLNATDQQLIFYVEAGGFNLNSFEFVQT